MQIRVDRLLQAACEGRTDSPRGRFRARHGAADGVRRLKVEVTESCLETNFVFDTEDCFSLPKVEASVIRQEAKSVIGAAASVF